MNEVDNQVRAVHKILGYDPIQKSFSALKYVIGAKDPQHHRIIVAEHRFLLLEGSPVQRGTLASSCLSHQATEAEGRRAESEDQVAELGQFEDEFSVFDQVNLSKDPASDLGDPSLTEADLLSIGTPSQAKMGGGGGSHNPSFLPLHLSLSLFRLGRLPPNQSHHLHSPNFLLLLSLPIQKGRGLPKAKSPWIGGDLAPLRRKMKPDELQNN